MGGSSKSKSSQTTTTNVTTTTSTSMGDVGLTGAQAVDFAAVLETGATERDRINADVLNNMVMATGNAWNTLIGGAGYLVETSAKAAENIVDAAPIVAEQARIGLIEGAEAGAKSSQAATITSQIVPVAGIVLLGIFMIVRKL